MTQEEITVLAGHRIVSPWVMKLAMDVANAEREACALICDDIGLFHKASQGSDLCFGLAKVIRARGEA
jgi:hypothetical protein